MNPAARFLALTALASLSLVAACGKDDGNPARPVTNPITVAVVEDSLDFTIGDLTLTMGDSALVCCGLFDPDFVNERAMRVVFYDPANQNAGWQFLILIDRAQQGEVANLPTTVVAPSKVPRISMFVATPSNEFSSDAQGSSGTITVHSFSCSATAIRIHFSVDATIHSEFWDGGAVRVQGTFRGEFPPQSCS